jgi:hypothetical protein
LSTIEQPQLQGAAVSASTTTGEWPHAVDSGGHRFWPLDQVLLELNRYDAEHYWYIASYGAKQAAPALLKACYQSASDVVFF